MSLPKHFDNPKEYFEECLKFFREYKYLYNYPNTDILIHDILGKILIDNDDEIDIGNVSINTQNYYLKVFFEKLERLQVFYEDFVENIECDVKAPLSPKKKHEIIYLSKEIEKICGEVNCDVVVDLGSGLGYLDQLIVESTGYKVLGIECNDSHYVGAKKRQRKYHQNSIDDVKFLKHTVNEHSNENINVYLQDKFPGNKGFCLSGLHACADLTIDAIKLFFKMEDAKALVLMPCCYHKMVESNGCFKNFPLSECLKDIFEKNKATDYVRVPFLRLAAQPSTIDENLNNMVFNLLSRAVLQLYALRHNCKLKRNKRKAVKTKTMENNFTAYIQDATSGFTLVNNVSSELKDKVEICNYDLEELTSLWNSLDALTFKKAGIFIQLQFLLQPVIENFILYDRLVFIKENGVTNCRFKRILNEKISPRCLALLANK